jgi:hypothetical protein
MDEESELEEEELSADAREMPRASKEVSVELERLEVASTVWESRTHS